MAEGRRFAIMDRRGCGASPRDVKDLSLEAQVADIEAVLEQAGLERTDIFTVADGAAVCLAFAARRPERVGRLVLWCPFAAGEQVGEGNLTGLLARDFRLGIRAWADIIIPSGFPDELRRYRADLRNDTSAELWPLHHQFLATLDVRPDLSEVKAPTLVVHRDRVLPIPVEVGKSVAAMISDAQLMIVEGDSVHQSLGDQSYVESVLEFLDEGRDAQPRERPELPSGTAIILFADIVDSTALTERLGDAAFREKARELDEELRAIIRENGGTPVEGKLLGDGVLAVFTSARQAIEAARRCGRAGSHGGLPLHLGLHAGDVIREGNNVYGGAVNIASRISGLSAPGEVLVSDTVRGLARTSAGVTFDDRGERKLKGIAEPQRLFAVRAQSAGS
jgi:class 3 adenylate cyclase